VWEKSLMKTISDQKFHVTSGLRGRVLSLLTDFDNHLHPYIQPDRETQPVSTILIL